MRNSFVIKYKPDKDLYLAKTLEHGYTTARIESEYVLRFSTEKRAKKEFRTAGYKRPWLKKIFTIIELS